MKTNIKNIRKNSNTKKIIISDEKTTLEFAIEQIKMNTRRFAKRQITWFKRTENVSWFDYLTDRTEIIRFIEKITTT